MNQYFVLDTQEKCLSLTCQECQGQCGSSQDLLMTPQCGDTLVICHRTLLTLVTLHLTPGAGAETGAGWTWSSAGELRASHLPEDRQSIRSTVTMLQTYLDCPGCSETLVEQSEQRWPRSQTPPSCPCPAQCQICQTQLSSNLISRNKRIILVPMLLITLPIMIKCQTQPLITRKFISINLQLCK